MRVSSASTTPLKLRGLLAAGARRNRGIVRNSCVRGHSDADGGRIWQSRQTPWTVLLAGRDAQAVFAKDGLFDELKKALAERVLNAEIDDHLDGEAAAGEAQQPQRLFEEEGA